MLRGHDGHGHFGQNRLGVSKSATINKYNFIFIYSETNDHIQK